MSISPYSILAGLLWFQLFILFITVFRKSTAFLRSVSIGTLLFITALGLVRLFFSVEFPFMRIISSTTWFPAVQDFLRLPVSARLTVGYLLLILWGAGTVITLLISLIKEFRFAERARTFPFHSDEAVLNILARVQENLNVSGKKQIAVRTDPDAASPYLAGFFHPTIYLPNIDFTEDELEFVFLHEVSHYKSYDLWIKLFLQIVIALFWWNPIVYFLKHDLDYMLEIKCDIHVVGGESKERRKHYYKSIVTVMANSNGIHLPAQPGALWYVSPASKTKLSHRLNYILNYKSPDWSVKWKQVMICLVACLIFVASYSIILQPFGMPTAADYGADAPYIVDMTDAYLVANEDGTYTVIKNNDPIMTVSDISQQPFSEMVIYH